MVVGAAAFRLHLVSGRGGEARPPRSSSSSGQDCQCVARHAAKLEGECPVEEHDEHAVGPLEDGGGVLQGEALLAEEDAAW